MSFLTQVQYGYELLRLLAGLPLGGVAITHEPYAQLMPTGRPRPSVGDGGGGKYKHKRSEVTLTLRRLMSYIYGAPILDVSRSHTRRSTVGRTPLDE